MKTILLFLSSFFFAHCHVFAQSDIVDTEILGALPVSFDIYQRLQSHQEGKNEQIDLSDYFVYETSEETEDADLELVLADVVGYRQLPTYTVDEFDLTPVYYDFEGEVNTNIEEEKEGLLELTNARLGVEILEDRAIRTVIAPSCGSSCAPIYCDDVEIAENTRIYEFPIKAHDPYLLQLRSDNTIHLVSDIPFGIHIEALQFSDVSRGIKGKGYEDMMVHFDSFEIQPVTVKVYDKWGGMVEVFETNTDEMVRLHISTYWWGYYWMSFHFHNQDTLLLKQLYLEE